MSSSSSQSAIRYLGLSLGALALWAASAVPAAACSIAAWSGTGGTTPVFGGPTSTPEVKRLKASCGLTHTGTAAAFVEENTRHDGEGGASPFRARFFVFTGATLGTPTVFRATSADAGAGNPVVEVDYDAVNQEFDFRVNGAAAGSTGAGSAPRDLWVGVQFAYQTGNPFTASIRTGSVPISLQTSAQGGADTVQSVRFGLVSPNGIQGQLHFDEYEASRAADPGTGLNAGFGDICRGDANGDNKVTAGDRFSITQELALPPVLAVGQPDCDGNGRVSAADRFCVTQKLSTFDPEQACQ